MKTFFIVNINGADTPLGKQDPARAAEAAASIRQAMRRDDIVKGIAGGYGEPMEKAGYKY